MAYRCDDCGCDDIVELVKQNVNTNEIVDSVDDSVECDNCGSTTIFKEEE